MSNASSMDPQSARCPEASNIERPRNDGPGSTAALAHRAQQPSVRFASDAAPSKDAPAEAAHSYRSGKSAAGEVSRRSGGGMAAYAATLEIADRCNESCIHCYQIQGQKGEMSTSELMQVMDELADMGVLFLTLSGGEATLRKDFLELVAYARKLRFAVKIYSNGLRISETMARELGRLAVQEVQISLYGAEAEVHDKITQVPGSFEKALQATRWLRQYGVQVVLKTPAMSVNHEQASEYAELVEGLGARYTMDPFLNPRENGDFAPLELAMTREQHLRLRGNSRFQRPAGQRAKRRVNADQKPCGACGSSIHVEANGEVRPCAQWSIATGQVQGEGGVRGAWYAGEKAPAIRNLTWGDLPGCRQCDLRHYCHRCFSDAHMQAGNALAPYALACTRASWAYEVKNGTAPTVLSEQSPALGPFREIAPHRFEAFAYELTPQDEERLRKHPWLLRATSDDTTGGGAAGGTGQLVQLGRGPRGLTGPTAPPSKSQKCRSDGRGSA